MQPFDALTTRAIISEAGPLLINRKVEKILQIGRDEIIIALRSKGGTLHLLISAQSSFGRICFVPQPQTPGLSTLSPFCQLLRKHLAFATLTGIDQLSGERIIDFVFACVDELGNKSTKVLTAEIMGRHSNLILWDKQNETILGASHGVTPDMSRQREIATGLKYYRPPKQDKINIFEVTKEDFEKLFAHLGATLQAGGTFFFEKPNLTNNTIQVLTDGLPPDNKIPEPLQNFEQWLLFCFSGLGRPLAEEIVEATGLPNLSEDACCEENCQLLWQKIATLQNMNEYKSSMNLDLSSYSVVSWWKDAPDSGKQASDWKSFSTVNDMIEEYFKGIQLRTEMQQLKDRIDFELTSQLEKLQNRIQTAQKLLSSDDSVEKLKNYGDLILANLSLIKPGEVMLSCENLYGGNGDQTAIELNPNLTAVQNAQYYYRQYAKARARVKVASASNTDAHECLKQVLNYKEQLEKAQILSDLQILKEKILDRNKKIMAPNTKSHQKDKSPQQRLMSTKSSDGFTIIVGRNKQENDLLISKLTLANDIWLHAQGLEGAHVVIKVPGKKEEVPLTTLKEAAQAAARFSRSGLGGRIKVIWTKGKYVHKIAKDKPGLVRYENEKVLEVNTAEPLSHSLRRLFS